MAGTLYTYRAISCHTYPVEVPCRIWSWRVVYTTVLKQLQREDKNQDMHKNKEEIWEVKEIVVARRVKGDVQYTV